MKSYTQSYRREYRAWNVSKNACLVKTNKKYPLYGAKGITFDETWLSFECFLKDIGEMPLECDGLILADPKKGFNKFNVSWGKVKRGMKPQSIQKNIRNKKVIVKNSMSFCLTLNQDHYAFIKRQAIMRSQQTGEVVTANDLIRETLTKTYPYSGQYDMFGGQK